MRVNEHICIQGIDELFEEITKKQEVVNNCILTDSKGLIQAASEIWAELESEVSEFEYNMLALAAENGYLKDFLNSTPFDYCWLASRVLNAYGKLLDGLIDRGFSKSTSGVAQSSKFQRYDLEFPLWSVVALCGTHERKSDYSVRLNRAVSSETGHRRSAQCEDCGTHNLLQGIS